jgi:hypothetical protein
MGLRSRTYPTACGADRFMKYITSEIPLVPALCAPARQCTITFSPRFNALSAKVNRGA